MKTCRRHLPQATIFVVCVPPLRHVFDEIGSENRSSGWAVARVLHGIYLSLSFLVLFLLADALYCCAPAALLAIPSPTGIRSITCNRPIKCLVYPNNPPSIRT